MRFRSGPGKELDLCNARNRRLRLSARLLKVPSPRLDFSTLDEPPIGERVLMRKLFFTTGSPFARAVRILLAEKGLQFEREETYTTPSVEERARVTPTLQVPMLIDGDLKLWDSTVIVEYLMISYPNPPEPPGQYPLASDYIRPAFVWHDKLVLATLQTFGASTATISQLQWSGVGHNNNSHSARCAVRLEYLLNWFEEQLVDSIEGFVPGVVSAQDVFLACWCQFIERRPLGLGWRASHRPKITALITRMEHRRSFQHEPVLWWEPGVTYATPAEVEWAATKTIHEGPSFAEWSSRS
jgi:glutathione S-transferase